MSRKQSWPSAAPRRSAAKQCGRRRPRWQAPCSALPSTQYVKGGRLPLGFRRTWAQPAPGQRPVAAGIEIDPEGAVIVREIFLLVRAGRTLKQVSEALSRQYGRQLGISRLHAILHHPLIRWPPSAELRIVDDELHREALLALRGRRGKGRELQCAPTPERSH